MIPTGSSLPGILTTQAVSILSLVAQGVSIVGKVLMGAFAQEWGVPAAFIIPVALVLIGGLIAYRTSADARAQDFERASTLTGPLPIITAKTKN